MRTKERRRRRREWRGLGWAQAEGGRALELGEAQEMRRYGWIGFRRWCRRVGRTRAVHRDLPAPPAGPAESPSTVGRPLRL